MPPSPQRCEPRATGVTTHRTRRDMPFAMGQNGGMIYVPSPMIEELRNELATFKRASGADWACAAMHLAGVVEALLDEADSATS